MAKLKSQEFGELAQAELEAVKALDGLDRELTDDEKAERGRRMEKATTLVAQARAAKSSEALDAEVAEFAKSLDGFVADPKGGDVKDDKPTRSRLSDLVLKSAEFDAMVKTFPGGRPPEKLRVQSDPIALKSLFTGASSTSGGAFVVNEQTGIFEPLGRRPLSIRDVIDVRRTGSDTVEYVVATSHTNNAAPVPEATSSAFSTAPEAAGALVPVTGGGYKPEGAWAYERKTEVVKTIAEWVPASKRALADVAQLEGIINSELLADLEEAEETQIISGDGNGENLSGILDVSGTQAQAYSVDILQTLRKSLTKVRVNGRSAPSAIGLNPTELETIDLMRDADGRYLGNGPWASGPRTVWGVPVFESEAIPAGTGIVADWKKAVLWDREEASVTFSDSHLDFFTRNLVALLAEERVAFGVIRPTAFVIADLTP